MTKMPGLLSRNELNAIVAPSGEKTGIVSVASVVN